MGIEAVPVEIVALVVSTVHAYEGRPQDGPKSDPEPAARELVTVRAGLGLVGDRYFNRPIHRHAAVTVFDADALDDFAAEAGLLEVPDPHLTRRNIALRGFPVDQLASRRRPDGGRSAGAIFSLDSGSGAIRFQAHRPANPCAWMDVAVAPGAFKGLRGRGGVRCEPLDDGELRLGPAVLKVLSR
ncbi:molybdenum cofactor biosysynthesis protein [Kribbella sp. NPDC006257]|uniref:molybdenum cofactor biosysynthesis protein n=1 Tax=Kribbella sp. NPDC006257 TaxID=3156738 RepID=UPI0033B3736A